eukprot:7718248-Lingulodinium_polyedra.AAC.1
MGAAAGTAAGSYGAARGSVQVAELQGLRRAAKSAATHGAAKAAAEVVFGLLSPARRLDPATMA